MGQTKEKSGLSPAYVLAVLAIGVFMAQLDATIFVPALNSVVTEFNSSYQWVIWAVTIYMLAFTVTMPLAGKIADLYGRKRLYVIGVGLFCIGSLACGLAWDINSLLAFRVVQAVGGGMILPAALSEIGHSVPEKKRGMAMGIMMAVNAVAAIIGPNLGGFLVEHLGWRYIFYINPPIGIVAILLALRFSESYGNEKHSIDIPGAALLGGMLLTFMYGIIRLEEQPLTDVTVYPLFLASAVLLILLVAYERRAKEPIISIPLLARTDVLALNFAALAFGVCFFSVVMYVPSYAQLILGLGAQDSGSILTPLTVSVLIMAIVGGKLADKYGIRLVLLAGSLVTCVTLFAMVYLLSGTLSLAVILLIMGIGVGFCMGSFQSLMLEMVPGKLKGSASGIVNTFMNIGGIIGPTIACIYISDASKKLEALQKSMASPMSPGMSMGGPGASSGSPDMQAMMLQLVRDTMEPAFQNIYMLAAACSVALVILIGFVAVKRYFAVRAESQEPETA